MYNRHAPRASAIDTRDLQRELEEYRDVIDAWVDENAQRARRLRDAHERELHKLKLQHETDLTRVKVSADVRNTADVECVNEELQQVREEYDDKVAELEEKIAEQEAKLQEAATQLEETENEARDRLEAMAERCEEMRSQMAQAEVRRATSKPLALPRSPSHYPEAPRPPRQTAPCRLPLAPCFALACPLDRAPAASSSPGGVARAPQLTWRSRRLHQNHAIRTPFRTPSLPRWCRRRSS